ncbi:MAG: alpha/beta hydrolase [Acidimicrobiia bacterium]|nr:alpha/beta hydrolase [Acidimicrobiia bacterium]
MATTFEAHDGLRIAVERRPAAGRGLVAVHATGFCSAVWWPVIDDLPGYDAVLLDQRGHGASDEPPLPIDWWDVGRDVLTAADRMAWERRPYGVGHSSGAAVLAMAEILRPGTFAGLVLVEPILFPPPHGRVDDHPMALRAEQRRDRFPHRDAAREHYRGRGAFAGWDDDVLEAFLACGLVDDPDGEGLRLACRPAFEAESYRSGASHGAFDRLGELDLPVLLVGGERSDTHGDLLLDRQAAAIPGARTVVIEGATHFVPMERPAELAGLVRRAFPTA